MASIISREEILPKDYKAWEPGDIERWVNDWGWRKDPCDPISGDTAITLAWKRSMDHNKGEY